MSSLLNEENELLDEICRKHNIEPHYLKELFRIEKEYADRNMSKRRGIFDKISDIVMDWVEQEEERRSIL
ncbi:DNA modification system-associated small protein [Paenibacillus cellulositrophicus]|uniref:DNA modification system-associated small protein n=1 Tax=Paenibacillus cellulositrophicus TaxID=562959 RepID=UPI003D961A93